MLNTVLPGEVKCHRGSTFGIRCWVLPAAHVIFPAGMGRFREFAAAILEGKVRRVRCNA